MSRTCLPLLLLGALLGAAPAVAQDARGDLPDIGNPASTTISVAE